MLSFERRAPARGSLWMVALASAISLMLMPRGSDAATTLFTNFNGAGVLNNPRSATTFQLSGPATVTQITTYHWNGGRGSAPGTIALRGPTGTIYGPFLATGSAGQGGAPNVNWTVAPNVTLPRAGTYAVIDSNPATWSWNNGSKNAGFALVVGTYTIAQVPPKPPPPPPPPPSPKPPLASPCHTTTGATLWLAKPNCEGPVGIAMWFYVAQPLKAAPTAIIFAPPPFGALPPLGGARNMPANVNAIIAVTTSTSVGPCAIVCLQRGSGNGTTVGSVYAWTTQPQLCVGVGRGTGRWAWYVQARYPGGAAPFVDYWVVDC